MEAINKERFENEAKNGLVVLDFSAPWCPDCVKIEPIMKLLSEEYAGKVKFFKINIDSEEELKECVFVCCHDLGKMEMLKSSASLSNLSLRCTKRMFVCSCR